MRQMIINTSKNIPDEVTVFNVPADKITVSQGVSMLRKTEIPFTDAQEEFAKNVLHSLHQLIALDESKLDELVKKKKIEEESLNYLNNPSTIPEERILPSDQVDFMTADFLMAYGYELKHGDANAEEVAAMREDFEEEIRKIEDEIELLQKNIESTKLMLDKEQKKLETISAILVKVTQAAMMAFGDSPYEDYETTTLLGNVDVNYGGEGTFTANFDTKTASGLVSQNIISIGIPQNDLNQVSDTQKDDYVIIRNQNGDYQAIGTYEQIQSMAGANNQSIKTYLANRMGVSEDELQNNLDNGWVMQMKVLDRGRFLRRVAD